MGWEPWLACCGWELLIDPLRLGFRLICWDLSWPVGLGLRLGLWLGLGLGWAWGWGLGLG